MKKGIIILLLVSLAIRVILFLQQHSVWWDASIYLGMGRALFSNYQIGIWEPLRPLLWPIILGFFWKLGLDEILIGHLIQVALSLGIIYLTYAIARNSSKSDNVALIAAALVSFIPIFVSFTFRLYTEIPAVFLSLFSIWLMQKDKHFSSGLFAGLAFLAKFPAGLVIIAGIIASSYKDVKKIILGFIIAIAPYFIYNYLVYGGDFLLPITQGKYTITYAGVWIFSQPWHFYLNEFLSQNIFFIFSIMGLAMLLRKKAAAIPVAGLILLAYFSLEPHKEPRFMILFLPFFAIMAGYGISRIKVKYAPLIVGIISLGLLILSMQPEPEISKAANEYYNFGMDSYANGEVLTATPNIKLSEITNVMPIYYMVFDTNLSKQWESYIKENSKNIAYIFLDNCDGGIFCPPWDSSCPEARDSLFNTSEKSMPYHKAFAEGICEYHIFYRNPHD